MTGQTSPDRLKVVVIHPALAPYRVDQFNLMSRLFDVTVIFLFDNVWNHPFDQEALLAQAEFKYIHLVEGLEYKGRVFTRKGLLRTLRRLAPDVVISVEFSFATQLLGLMKAMGLFKPRLGSTIDDSLAICQRPQSRARSLARALLVRNLDYLLLLSAPVADYYGRTYGIAKERLVVAPIVQDPARLRSRAATIDRIADDHAQRFDLVGRKVLLFVGRLIPEKGLLPLLRKVGSQLRADPDLRFVIVGDGVERDELQRLIEAESLNSSVILAGRFEDAEVHAWYVCASGFILPSVYEPFGAVVNEALIFGVPVLCSRAAGSAPLAEASGGVLFSPADETETVQAFASFTAGLSRLETCRLEDRPSLMQDQTPSIARELSKLAVAPLPPGSRAPTSRLPS